jgi:hypothetical protein
LQCVLLALNIERNKYDDEKQYDYIVLFTYMYYKYRTLDLLYFVDVLHDLEKKKTIRSYEMMKQNIILILMKQNIILIFKNEFLSMSLKFYEEMKFNLIK